MTTQLAHDERPLPSSRRLDALDEPFWRACRDNRFLLQRCATCRRHYWPASSCVQHGSGAMEWVETPGRGVIHTFAVVRRTVDPAFASRAPYNVAVIRLDEGVLFHSAIANAGLDDLRVGRRVHVDFEQRADGEKLPLFRLCS